MVLLRCIAIAILSMGCSQYGSHSHYIISEADKQIKAETGEEKTPFEEFTQTPKDSF